MSPLDFAALIAASAGAGVMNALAGGGTLLTFPTLLLLGLPATVANATSTVALLPGAAASMAGYRREVATHRAWLGTLMLPSLLGGAAGSLLLLATPDRIFARLAPWLILFATASLPASSRGWRRGGAPRTAAPEAPAAVAPARPGPGWRSSAWPSTAATSAPESAS